MRNVIYIVLAIVVAAAAAYLFMTRQSAPDDPAVVEQAPVTPAIVQPTLGFIDDARINNAASEPGNWLAYGRTYEEQRFSPLTQVNKDTVSGLGLAWYRDMGTNRAQEATPVIGEFRDAIHLAGPPQRGQYIPGITNDVDDLRIWPAGHQAVHMHHVSGRLFGPADLALPLCKAAEESVDEAEDTTALGHVSFNGR